MKRRNQNNKQGKSMKKFKQETSQEDVYSTGIYTSLANTRKITFYHRGC